VDHEIVVPKVRITGAGLEQPNAQLPVPKQVRVESTLVIAGELELDNGVEPPNFAIAEFNEVKPNQKPTTYSNGGVAIEWVSGKPAPFRIELQAPQVPGRFLVEVITVSPRRVIASGTIDVQ